jgi:hypothetical protein
VLRPNGPSWTLPDGSKLRLVKATWGTNHLYRYGNRPIDFLYPLFPINSRSNFNFRVARISAPLPGALVVWLKRSGIPTNSVSQTPIARTVTGRGSAPPPGVAALLSDASAPFKVSVVDDNGVESRTSSNVRVAPIGSTEGLVGIVLSSYPRRAESVGIRIHWSSPIRPASAASGPSLLAEFRLPNRARELSRSAWEPEPLPATCRTNGLEVTLVKLETGVTVADASRSMGISGGLSSTSSDSNRRTYSRAMFAVRENGLTTTKWRISRMVLNDAAGETHHVMILASQPLNAAEVTFPDSLWLDEPAWKIAVEFTRIGDFPPEELWCVKGLQVPAAGQSIPLDLATNLHGAEVKLADIGWTTRGAILGTTGIPPILPNPGGVISPQLALSLQAPSSVQVALIEVRDDQDRQATITGTSPMGPAAFGISSMRTLRRSFQFSLPADAKTVDVTIGASQRRNFEFYAKPVLGGTSDSPAK